MTMMYLSTIPPSGRNCRKYGLMGDRSMLPSVIFLLGRRTGSVTDSSLAGGRQKSSILDT